MIKTWLSAKAQWLHATLWYYGRFLVSWTKRLTTTEFVIVAMDKCLTGDEYTMGRLQSMLKNEFEDDEVYHPPDEINKNEREANFEDHDISDKTTLPQSLILFAVTRGKAGQSLFGGKYQPIGHVAIERARNAQSFSLTKSYVEKLLKSGIPEGAVRQLAKAKGLDYDKLIGRPSHQDSQDETSKDFLIQDTGIVEAVSIGRLVVDARYRGLGLGTALAKAAVVWSAVEIGASEVKAYARTEELLQWYRRLGARLDRDDHNVVYQHKDKMGKSTSDKQKNFQGPRSFSIAISSLSGKSMEENFIKMGMPKHVSVRKKLVRSS